MCRLYGGRWRALAAFVLWLVPAVVSADTVTLAWDPSAGATGYTLKWGTTAGSYPNAANAGSSTSYAITGLTAGATYYAVAQAYNASDVSALSTPLQFTVPGGTPPPPCSYSINPVSINAAAAASTGTVLVTTQTGCAWNATSASGFLTFQNGTGRAGSGSVGFSVAANTATTARTGTGTIAGIGFAVSQAAATAACTYSISPATTSVSSPAATGTITVTTQAGCAWSATSNSSFLTFQNGTGRTGPGSVSFSVAANTSTSGRTGSATVAGKSFAVTQAGVAASCSYTISPTSFNAPAAGTTGTITVTTQSGCAWSATTGSAFLTFQNGTGRTGSGSVGFTVTANPATSLRTGTATVAGKSFTVWQAAQACTYVVNPTNINTSAAATTGSITVTTQTGCSWSASSLSTFVTFQDGTGRSGSGSVGFTLPENPTTSARTAVAGIAAATVYITQAGAATVPPPPVASPWSSDFDGDGKNDLLVHDSIAGTVEAWFLDGATIKGTQSLSHSLDANWAPVGRGDFNADGKPDIVWQHKTEGWVELWYMDGTNRIAATPPSISRLADPLWQIVGVGDFNSDGKPDLMWQHATLRDLAVWQMDGATVNQTLSLTPVRADPLWKVVGVADFNNDGKTDLLWRHTGLGDVAVWLMNGVSRIVHAPLTPFSVPDQRWQVGAVTDLNGDGKPDLVWEHTDGTVMIWHMNGTSRTTYPIIPVTMPAGWNIVGPK